MKLSSWLVEQWSKSRRLRVTQASISLCLQETPSMVRTSGITTTGPSIRILPSIWLYLARTTLPLDQWFSTFHPLKVASCTLRNEQNLVTTFKVCNPWIIIKFVKNIDQSKLRKAHYLFSSDFLQSTKSEKKMTLPRLFWWHTAPVLRNTSTKK